MTVTSENQIQVLTEEEINERVQILHKLREHLLEQRNRFYKYLDLLEHEEKDIITGDVEKLQYHTELEKDLAVEIISFQKVIDPLNDMYRLSASGGDIEIPKLQESLEHIREEVVHRSELNQELLQSRMDTVRNEIKSIKKTHKSNPVYDDFKNKPAMIDITT